VGPWTNALLRLDEPAAVDQVRTTKGVHLIVKGQLSRHALLVMSNSDKRIFFVIPWMGNSMIGTTDTDYTGSPDEVKVEQDDIDYLAAATRRVFPDYDFSEANIINAFAGLRPLLKSGASPRRASRRHFIHETASGMLVVVGGKYTTYRAIAEACVKRLNPPALEKDFRLYANGAVSDRLDAVAETCGLSVASVQALADLYGTRYNDVLTLAQNDPALKEPICSCSPFIKAQIAYALQTELAQTADDIISRRLSTAYLACGTRDCEKVSREFVAAARATI
jgi:glycerol-3-phosphate dehydrogenase